MKIRSAVTLLATAASLATLVIAAPANAATAPTPDTITICAGNAVATVDASGNALAPDVQADLVQTIQDHCAALRSDATPQVITPDSSRIGHLAAHLIITPGNLTITTTASSMPTNFKKTLSCAYKIGPHTQNGLAGLPWEPCGSASGSGSSLSTRSNGFCPAKGLLVDAVAELKYKSTFDESSATGITE